MALADWSGGAMDPRDEPEGDIGRVGAYSLQLVSTRQQSLAFESKSGISLPMRNFAGITATTTMTTRCGGPRGVLLR